MSGTQDYRLGKWKQALIISFFGCLIWLGVAFAIPVQAAESPAQLQSLETQVQTLADLVDRKQWFEIRSYIHGPMGLIRKDLSGLVRQLPKAQQQQTLTASRKLTASLEKMDLAAQDFDATRIKEAQASLEKSLDELKALVS